MLYNMWVKIWNHVLFYWRVKLDWGLRMSPQIEVKQIYFLILFEFKIIETYVCLKKKTYVSQKKRTLQYKGRERERYCGCNSSLFKGSTKLVRTPKDMAWWLISLNMSTDLSLSQNFILVNYHSEKCKDIYKFGFLIIRLENVSEKIN